MSYEQNEREVATPKKQHTLAGMAQSVLKQAQEAHHQTREGFQKEQKFDSNHIALAIALNQPSLIIPVLTKSRIEETDLLQRLLTAITSHTLSEETYQQMQRSVEKLLTLVQKEAEQEKENQDSDVDTKWAVFKTPRLQQATSVRKVWKSEKPWVSLFSMAVDALEAQKGAEKNQTHTPADSEENREKDALQGMSASSAPYVEEKEEEKEEQQQQQSATQNTPLNNLRESDFSKTLTGALSKIRAKTKELPKIPEERVEHSKPQDPIQRYIKEIIEIFEITGDTQKFRTAWTLPAWFHHLLNQANLVKSDKAREAQASILKILIRRAFKSRPFAVVEEKIFCMLLSMIEENFGENSVLKDFMNALFANTQEGIQNYFQAYYKKIITLTEKEKAQIREFNEMHLSPIWCAIEQMEAWEEIESDLYDPEQDPDMQDTESPEFASHWTTLVDREKQVNDAIQSVTTMYHLSTQQFSNMKAAAKREGNIFFYDSVIPKENQALLNIREEVHAQLANIEVDHILYSARNIFCNEKRHNGKCQIYEKIKRPIEIALMHLSNYLFTPENDRKGIYFSRSNCEQRVKMIASLNRLKKGLDFFRLQTGEAALSQDVPGIENIIGRIRLFCQDFIQQAPSAALLTCIDSILMLGEGRKKEQSEPHLQNALVLAPPQKRERNAGRSTVKERLRAELEAKQKPAQKENAASVEVKQVFTQKENAAFLKKMKRLLLEVAELDKALEKGEGLPENQYKLNKAILILIHAVGMQGNKASAHLEDLQVQVDFLNTLKVALFFIGFCVHAGKESVVDKSGKERQRIYLEKLYWEYHAKHGEISSLIVKKISAAEENFKALIEEENFFAQQEALNAKLHTQAHRIDEKQIMRQEAQFHHAAVFNTLTYVNDTLVEEKEDAGDTALKKHWNTIGQHLRQHAFDAAEQACEALPLAEGDLQILLRQQLTRLEIDLKRLQAQFRKPILTLSVHSVDAMYCNMTKHQNLAIGTLDTYITRVQRDASGHEREQLALNEMLANAEILFKQATTATKNMLHLENKIRIRLQELEWGRLEAKKRLGDRWFTKKKGGISAKARERAALQESLPGMEELELQDELTERERLQEVLRTITDPNRESVLDQKLKALKKRFAVSAKKVALPSSSSSSSAGSAVGASATMKGATAAPPLKAKRPTAPGLSFSFAATAESAVTPPVTAKKNAVGKSAAAASQQPVSAGPSSGFFQQPRFLSKPDLPMLVTPEMEACIKNALQPGKMIGLYGGALIYMMDGQLDAILDWDCFTNIGQGEMKKRNACLTQPFTPNVNSKKPLSIARLKSSKKRVDMTHDPDLAYPLKNEKARQAYMAHMKKMDFTINTYAVIWTTSGAIFYSGLEGKEISIEEFKAVVAKGELRLAGVDMNTLEENKEILEKNPVLILRAFKAISTKKLYLEEKLEESIRLHGEEILRGVLDDPNHPEHGHVLAYARGLADTCLKKMSADKRNEAERKLEWLGLPKIFGEILAATPSIFAVQAAESVRDMGL